MSKYNFANASIEEGTYKGEAARPYVAAAILSADTLANNYCSIMENVHAKAVLRKFSGTIIEDASCTFATSATPLTLGEVVLETKPLKVNEQVCNKDLRATWESAAMRGQNSAAPADFTSFAAQYVAAKVAETVEKNIWGGNFDPTDSTLSGGGEAGTAFDGLMHHIVDDQANLGYDKEVSGGSGAFVAGIGANGILKHLDDVVNNAPSTVQSDSNSTIYMSRKSLFLLHRSMAGLAETSGGYSPTFVGEGRPVSYLGFNIIAPAGMTNDSIIFSAPENLYFGTDLLTDHISSSILDLSGVTGDDVTRIIMQFSGGTQIVDAGSMAVVRRVA
jgi:hypothetical protein